MLDPTGTTGPVEVNYSADFDKHSATGLTVEVQSLEERVVTTENAVHAGNISFQLADVATPTLAITAMCIDHSSGTTGYYFNFDAPSGGTSHERGTGSNMNMSNYKHEIDY